MTITETGHYPEITATQYHADQLCETPSLSSSIIKVLINETPQHAFTQHPRLNPNFERDEDDKFVIGNVAHSVMLNDFKALAVLQFDDYRTKDAKSARENAKARGLIPILEKNMDRVHAMIEAGRMQLAEHLDASAAFTAGHPEQTIVWREDHDGQTVWFRARLDWLSDDRKFFDDYKTTECADPDTWQRVVDSVGHDIQAAFYRRGIRAVFGIRQPKMRFIVQETSEPYALSVVDLTPEYFELAERRIDAAIKKWCWCRKNGQWPGYSARTCTLAPKTWSETRQMEKEVRDADFARSAGVEDGNILALSLAFHKPI